MDRLRDCPLPPLIPIRLHLTKCIPNTIEPVCQAKNSTIGRTGPGASQMRYLRVAGTGRSGRGAIPDNGLHHDNYLGKMGSEEVVQGGEDKAAILT